MGMLRLFCKYGDVQTGLLSLIKARGIQLSKEELALKQSKDKNDWEVIEAPQIESSELSASTIEISIDKPIEPKEQSVGTVLLNNATRH